MKLTNQHLGQLEFDHFHHLGFSTKSKDIKSLFQDVKFVCLSGSVDRVFNYAKNLNRKLKMVKEDDLVDLCSTDRYSLYKVGPILIANHGMGVPSACIILNELFKLLHYAGANDVTFFRMGTCGGLGLEPGTVVLTKRSVNGLLLPKHSQVVLGNVVEYDTTFEHGLSEEVLSLATEEKAQFDFDVVIGDTMCSDDFYEGQARLDGAFCPYSRKDRDDFLEKAYDSGVRNIEMESLVFASMCIRAGVKACIVCVVLVNRLNDKDQILISKERVKEFEARPGDLVFEFMKQHLNLNDG